MKLKDIAVRSGLLPLTKSRRNPVLFKDYMHVVQEAHKELQLSVNPVLMNKHPVADGPAVEPTQGELAVADAPAVVEAPTEAEAEPVMNEHPATDEPAVEPTAPTAPTIIVHIHIYGGTHSIQTTPGTESTANYTMLVHNTQITTLCVVVHTQVAYMCPLAPHHASVPMLDNEDCW